MLTRISIIYKSIEIFIEICYNEIGDTGMVFPISSLTKYNYENRRQLGYDSLYLC